MAEYIKLDDAIQAIGEGALIFASSTLNVGAAMLRAFNEIKIADVRENVHSEWVSVCGLYHCKNCGCVAPYDVEADVIMYWPELNYCPRCGADMRGESDG